jgi:antitoxin VapB
MALNIKDEATERLAAEVATLTGESKTRAVRVALQERRDRLAAGGRMMDRAERLQRFLTNEAWPISAPNGTNRATTKAEREAILGYGPEGM